MKKLFLALFLSLFLLSVVSAVQFSYNESSIVSDVYLYGMTTETQYYSYITFDLGQIFNNPNLYFEGLQANLSLHYLSGSANSENLLIYLLPDQSIELSSYTASYINSIPWSVYVNRTWDMSEGYRKNFDISPLVRDLLVNNNSARYLTLRIESATNNFIIPNSKVDDTYLKVGKKGSAWNELIFGGKGNFGIDVEPKLTIKADFNVVPYQSVLLPQINCNMTTDMNGLERRYLFCSYWIDGNGSYGNIMQTQTCPENPINYTFTDSEIYSVIINYMNLIWNNSLADWIMASNGTCNQIEHNYIMNIPEPNIQSFWQMIWNWIKMIWCNLFGGIFC